MIAGALELRCRTMVDGVAQRAEAEEQRRGVHKVKRNI